MKVGIDIIEISEIPTGERQNSFLEKFFSEKEIEYINTKAKKEQTIAGIFASKEAFLKALELGIGKIMLKTVEVLHKPNGAPYINKNKEIEEVLNMYGFKDISLSISHSVSSAVAICNIY